MQRETNPVINMVCIGKISILSLYAEGDILKSY